jgi:hypothetical protein
VKRKDSTSPVGSLVKQVLEKHPAFSANPLGDWGLLAGEQVARYSQPRSLKEKVLVIVAYDSVWKHHLELNKEELLLRINLNRPEPLVEKIAIKVGEIHAVPPVLNPTRKELDKVGRKRSSLVKKRKAPVRPLTPEEQSLLASLPDPDLRKIGKRLLQRLPANEG